MDTIQEVEITTDLADDLIEPVAAIVQATTGEPVRVERVDGELVFVTPQSASADVRSAIVALGSVIGVLS